MSETRKQARALLAAATKSPWQECGIARCGCGCGNVWSVPSDVPVASATRVWEGGEFLAAQTNANAALIAAAPTLIATLCDEADAADDLYRSVKARLGQTPGDGQLPHDVIDALERRAVEAEAAAASMREALAAVLNEHNPVRFTVCQDGECEHLALAEIAMANPAGRAILDRLERAETERDALRAERDTILTMVPPFAAAEARANNAEAERDAVERERDDMQREIVRLQSCVENAEAEQWDASERATNLKVERDALRAERDEMAAKVRRLEGRKSTVCDCADKFNAMRAHGLVSFVAGDSDCPRCSGSGAVIVEGEE